MRKKIAILAILLTSLTGCNNKDEDITISVASSLTQPISEIVQIYEQENNIKVNINSGPSGTLKKQIENGAEVDVFFSANELYMEELLKENLVSKENISHPVSNQLVLIKNNNTKENINSLEELKTTNMSISIGETSTVPIGQYSKEVLENLKIFDTIKDKIIYGKDANTIKAYVESGNVDLGIVYKSDATNLKNSYIICEIPSNTHEKIKYALAPIQKNEQSEKIIELINSEEGKKILEKYGFKIED